jgi:long-subunit acyl-CoA synthetase (AMP-forming)
MFYFCSAAARTEDGYLKTGDIGILDEDGYLWLTGRRSDMFKLSTGRKVVPGAIEEAFTGIKAVEYGITFGAKESASRINHTAFLFSLSERGSNLC